MITYISTCCDAEADFVSDGYHGGKYVCSACGQDCSIKEPDTEPQNEQEV